MAVKDLLHGLTLACVAAVALGTLVGAVPNDQFPIKRAYPQEPLQDASFTSPSKDFSFQRTRQGDRWILHYQFQGAASKLHEVSCSISDADTEKLIKKFSYRNKDKASEMLTAIRKYVRENGPPVGSYGEPVFSTEYDEDKDVIVKARWQLKQGSIMNSVDQQNALAEQRKFTDWYNPKRASIRTAAEREFMKRHGFLEDPKQGWILNYAKLVEDATPALKSCVEAFGNEIGKNPELLMSFFQLMPFTLIRDKGTGSTTGGVRVPPSLLLQNEGDCDSKALTFCVLHRAHSNGLVLFRTFRKKSSLVPGHVLVGIEVYSSSSKWNPTWPQISLDAGFYENPIIVNNHYLVPCEVAGGHGRTDYSTIASRIDDTGVAIVKDDYVVIPIPAQ